MSENAPILTGSQRTWFQPGNQAASVAHRQNARTRKALTADLVRALADDFAEHGPDAVRECRIAEPVQYLRIIASLVPKELEVSQKPTEGMTQDELAAAIGILRGLLSDAASLDPEDVVVGLRSPDQPEEVGHILPSDGATEAGTVSEAPGVLRGGSDAQGEAVPGRKPRRKDGGGGGV